MYGFDKEEITQIIISMLVVAVAFSAQYLFASKIAFAAVFPVILLGVGTGFVLHELAHKFVAIKLGAFARYQAWETGLLMALVMAFATGGRFVFAAPGAVYIYAPVLSRKKNGYISIAGPLTNLLVGLFFMVIGLVLPDGYLSFAALSVASINFFLGFFNMIPIPPLDGSKVLAWNVAAWIALIIPLGILTFFF